MMRRRGVILVLAMVLGACSRAETGDVEHGRRLATVTGCISCHGERLEGHLFEENAQFALAWSSNLSRILPGWSNAQIETTLRTGRRPDGSPLWFMPTFAQQRLSHEEMRDLIAWSRTASASGELHPAIKFGPLFKPALAQGFQNSADEAVRLASRMPADRGPRFAEGRHLTSIACAECHGPDLKGAQNPQPGDAPDLVAAAAYTPESFRRLLKTGVMQNGKRAVLMGEEAPKRLSALTDAEVDSIQEYLRARAQQQRGP